jgi:hypothetical protein
MAGEILRCQEALNTLADAAALAPAGERFGSRSVKPMSISRMSPGGARRPSCSRRIRRGGYRVPSVCLHIRKPTGEMQRVNLRVPDEITDDFDLLYGGVRKFYAGEFFLEQYQQLELFEGINVKIVSEMRFICNSFGINI